MKRLKPHPSLEDAALELFAACLRARASERGLDARALARELGGSVAEAYRLLAGKRRPSLAVLLRLRELFACTLDELLELPEERAA